MDRALFPVFAMGALMLAMAGATVAGLFLARAAERSWDTSLRLALGAPAARLFGHFFAEGLVVAVLASLLALAVAGILSGTLRTWLPGAFPDLWSRASLGAPSRGGLCPGHRTASESGADPGPLLHLRRLDRDGPGRARNVKGHGALVVLQVALATLLLGGTSLLGRSLIGLLREDLGFHTRGIVKVKFAEVDDSVRPDPKAASASSTAAVAAIHRTLEALRAMPGIQGVGLSDLDLELTGESWAGLPWNQLGEVAAVTAGDGLAETMGLQLREGRAFSSGDLLTGRRVCMIDSTAARALFGDHALGRKVPSPRPDGAFS